MTQTVNAPVNGQPFDLLDLDRIDWTTRRALPPHSLSPEVIGIAEPAIFLPPATQPPQVKADRSSNGVDALFMDETVNSATRIGSPQSRADEAAGRAVAETRDRLSDVGTFVVAATAGFSSWAGWVSLGRAVGWSSVGPVDLAWLLPVSVDVYAFIAMRTWNNVRLSPETRRVAKWSSIAALALSISGNAAGHAVDAGVFIPSWPVVVLVAALAPILLFLTLHLRVLRTRDAADAARRARDRAEKRSDRQAARAARSDGSGDHSDWSDDRHDEPDRSTRPARRTDRSTSADRSKSTGADQSETRKVDRSARTTGRVAPTDRSTDQQHSRPVIRKGDAELVEKVIQLDSEHGRTVGRDVIIKHLRVGAARADRLRLLANDRKTGAGSPGPSDRVRTNATREVES